MTQTVLVDLEYVNWYWCYGGLV
ncbi:hypothetical protein JL09_g6002 [Pichia kudriavzevii]|uniref:Uncharacterized protein n=1 Tax=Pichia kudriavzevii TaxID=4909 RepID=A0A099NS48_PICKU|nr:hypothetical protein JL09_g6002 [Pichia kudriavzevii]